MTAQRFCTCHTIDLDSPQAASNLDGQTSHFFDGTPCHVAPCSAEEPCRELNEVHVEMFGGCWVMRAVWHGGKGAQGQLVDPVMEQTAREMYEADMVESDRPWTALTDQGRQVWRRMVMERGS